MSSLICISAGQLTTKKVDNPINRQHRYLNYGLLSLATVLARGGYEPVVIHGHFDSPMQVLATAELRGLVDASVPVLISVPSFYAVAWAKEFMSLCRAKFPSIRFFVGGRWVVDGRPELLQELLPDADCIVAGLAEDKIMGLINGRPALSKRTPTAANGGALEHPGLNYRLLHDRALYQPSIEVSRGCGMGCSFCQERDERLQPLKDPGKLVEEIAAIILRDSLIEMTPYFEASMFVPTRDWLQRFRRAMDKAAMSLRWRSEGRVDNIRADLIPDLASAGLKVLDLGLESASPLQLTRMKKTRSPQSYLTQAASLIEACGKSGIKVKVNLLLFAGETDETLAETVNWLNARRELIAGVSVGPVIAFGWPSSAAAYIEELTNTGASLHSTPCKGVHHLNLSEAFPHDHAVKIAREVSRSFMTAEQYYFLKSFSYFGRDYRYADFMRDVAKAPHDLSFDVSELSWAH